MSIDAKKLLSKRQRGNRLEPMRTLDLVQTSADLLCLHLLAKLRKKGKSEGGKNAQQMVLPGHSWTQLGQGEAKKTLSETS